MEHQSKNLDSPELFGKLLTRCILFFYSLARPTVSTSHMFCISFRQVSDKFDGC